MGAREAVLWRLMMQSESTSIGTWRQRMVLAAMVLALGFIVFIVLSNYVPLLPREVDPYVRVGVTLVLLAAALLARRSTSLHAYWPLLFAFFIACFATSLDLYTSYWMLDSIRADFETPAANALMKVKNGALIIATILLLTRLSGGTMGLVYVQKGNLRRGLSIGFIAFGIAAAISVPLARLMFYGSNLGLARILPWIPWLLIFVLANAAFEELLFRGLFLRKLEPFFGPWASNIVIAILFTLSHTGVRYTPDVLMFLASLPPLALAWGYIMQKTDSLWGSVLFHAGMDLPIILGLWSTAH
jgi:membrane protease YdiL (CAAX protease family)